MEKGEKKGLNIIPAKGRMFVSMLIFGTVGIFTRMINLPSAVIAMARGIIGLLFLASVSGNPFDAESRKSIRQNLLKLLFSGAALGLNWVFLFEAYRYTTVATATLCYYMAPVLIILASPLVVKERITVKKLLCCAAAFVGMIFVSGAGGIEGARGIVFGLLAACLYAAVVLLNRRISGIRATVRTMTQFVISSAVLLVYNLVTGGFGGIAFDVKSIIFLLVVGIVHTGIAYMLYFSSMEEVSSQSAALMSYIDPVVAVILSALLLSEPLGFTGIIGTVLIIGAAAVSELL